MKIKSKNGLKNKLKNVQKKFADSKQSIIFAVPYGNAVTSCGKEIGKTKS
jgi:hypothetical protein